MIELPVQLLPVPDGLSLLHYLVNSGYRATYSLSSLLRVLSTNAVLNGLVDVTDLDKLVDL